MVLTEHQSLSPTFSSGPPDVYEERVADWEEDFDNPKFWNVVVEHDGSIAGSAVGCALEVSSAHVGPARPDHAGFLGFAAVLPGARGLGVGRALGEAVTAWALEAGLHERRHRLAGDQPALVTGLARRRLPRHLHPGAPARRPLTAPPRARTTAHEESMRPT